MDIKKFKKQIKNESLTIPEMSNEVLNVAKKKNYITKSEKGSNVFVFFRKMSLIIAPILIFFVVISLTFISSNSGKNDYKLYSITTTKELQDLKNFKRVNAFNAFAEQLKDAGYYLMGDNIVDDSVLGGDTASEEPGESDSSGSDYSNTNVQEQEVDEADIIKTDGEHIYYLTNKYLLIYKVNNGEMSQIKKISLNSNDDNYNSFYNDYYHSSYQLYVTDQYLIVTYRTSKIEYLSNQSNSNEINPYYDSYNVANYVNFDIYDKTNYEAVYQYSADGTYIDTRLVNDCLYIVYSVYKEDDELPSDYVNSQRYDYKLSDVKYSKTLETKGYTIMIGFNLKTQTIHREVLLAAKDWTVVYATGKNIYLINVKNINNYLEDVIEPTKFSSRYVSTIIRYSLNNEKVEFGGIIVTGGAVLNQFYVDEYASTFRVVVNEESPAKHRLEIYDLNNVLDNEIQMISSIKEGIGKENESIKSIRFSDKSCLIVTFLQTDPLYYIDLTDSKNPVIINGYEEPGYNTYLQYLSDDVAIGFGYNGNFNYKMGLYQVIENEITKVDEITIGGSYLEVMYNHKALYYHNGYFGFGYRSYKYNYGDSLVSEEIKAVYCLYTTVQTTNGLKLQLVNTFNSEIENDALMRLVYINGYYYLASIYALTSYNSEFVKVNQEVFDTK